MAARSAAHAPETATTLLFSPNKTALHAEGSSFSKVAYYLRHVPFEAVGAGAVVVVVVVCCVVVVGRGVVLVRLFCRHTPSTGLGCSRCAIVVGGRRTTLRAWWCGRRSRS